MINRPLELEETTVSSETCLRVPFPTTSTPLKDQPLDLKAPLEHGMVKFMLATDSDEEEEQEDEQENSAEPRTWRYQSPLKVRQRLSLLFTSPQKKTAPSLITDDESRREGLTSPSGTLPGRTPLPRTLDAPDDSLTDLETLLNTIHNQRPVKEVTDVEFPASIPASRLVIYLFPEQRSLFQLEREMLCKVTNFKLRSPWRHWTAKPPIEGTNIVGPEWHKETLLDDKRSLSLLIAAQRRLIKTDEHYTFAVFKENMEPMLMAPVYPANEYDLYPYGRVVGVIRMPIYVSNGYEALKNTLRFVLEDRGRADSELHQFLTKTCIGGITFQRVWNNGKLMVMCLTLMDNTIQGSSIGVDMAREICELLHWNDAKCFDLSSMKRARFDTATEANVPVFERRHINYY